MFRSELFNGTITDFFDIPLDDCLVSSHRFLLELERINERPEPFQFYTESNLWTDEHTSKQMLAFHLNEAMDVSSRNAGFINLSVAWIASVFNIGRD